MILEGPFGAITANFRTLSSSRLDSTGPSHHQKWSRFVRRPFVEPFSDALPRSASPRSVSRLEDGWLEDGWTDGWMDG